MNKEAGKAPENQEDTQPTPEEQAAAQFNEFLAVGKNQAEFDRRVKKAIQTAVTNARSKWKEAAQGEPEENEIEAEIADLKRQLTLSENRTEAQGIANSMRYPVPPELMEYAVVEDKGQTIENAAALAHQFNADVVEGIRNSLAGRVPKANFGTNLLSREQILNEKDREKRWKLIAENPHLFTKRR